MRKQILPLTEVIIYGGGLATIFLPLLVLLPLFFAADITASRAVAQVSLVFIGGTMLLFWLLQRTLRKTIRLPTSPLLSAYLLFVLVVTLSTIGSLDRFSSLLPLFPTIPPSILPLIGLGFILLILTDTIRTISWALRFFGFLIVLSASVVLITIGMAAGIIPLLTPTTGTLLFSGTLVGTTLDLGWLAAILLPLALMYLFAIPRGSFLVTNPRKPRLLLWLPRRLSTAIIGFCVLTLLLYLLAINHTGLTLLASTGIILLFVILMASHHVPSIPQQKVLAAVILLILLMRLTISTPWLLSIPSPKTLPSPLAGQVTKATLFADPMGWRFLFGSGPGTFPQAASRTTDDESTNRRSATGVYHLLTTLGTIGLLTYAALFLLPLFSIFSIARRNTARILQDPIVISTMIMLLLILLGHLIFTPSTQLFVFFLLIVVFTLRYMHINIKPTLAETTRPKKNKARRRTSSPRPFSPFLELLPIGLLFGFAVIVLLLFWISSRIVHADVLSARATRLSSVQPIEAYAAALAAVRKNPYVARYRRQLGTLSLALAIATPRDGLDQTQKLIQQAIQEGRAAIALNDRDPRNWLLLGDVYAALTTAVPDSASWAQDAYQAAARLRPQNPLIRLRLARLAVQQAQRAEDPTTQARFAQSARLLMKDVWDAPEITEVQRQQIEQDLAVLETLPEVAGAENTNF